MSKNRKGYSAEEKAKIALEALKGNKTMSELSSTFGVHATQITNWKNKLKTGIAEIFSDKKQKKEVSHQNLVEDLYKTIGQQKVELEWLKKKVDLFKD